MRISDWSSDVCSSDLRRAIAQPARQPDAALRQDKGCGFEKKALGVPAYDSRLAEPEIDAIRAALQRHHITVGRKRRVGGDVEVHAAAAVGYQLRAAPPAAVGHLRPRLADEHSIGSASCRESVCQYVSITVVADE